MTPSIVVRTAAALRRHARRRWDEAGHDGFAWLGRADRAARSRASAGYRGGMEADLRCAGYIERGTPGWQDQRPPWTAYVPDDALPLPGAP